MGIICTGDNEGQIWRVNKLLTFMQQELSQTMRMKLTVGKICEENNKS